MLKTKTSTVCHIYFVFILLIVEEGYKLQLNSTIYYATISTDVRLNTVILRFTLCLNNSFYQTPNSVTLQLGSSNQFTSYFSLTNNGSLQTISFNDSDPEDTVDPLRVSGSIVYLSKAPVGEYQAIITATVDPQSDTETATISLTVTQGILYS